MITTAVVFDHRGRTSKGKEGPLEVRVTVDRRPYYINTGVRVREKEWRHGMIVNRVDAEELTERLNIVTRKIEKIVNGYIDDGMAVDIAEIRRRVYEGKEVEKVDSVAFLTWFGETVAQLPLKPNTLKHYVILNKRLNDWGIMRNWPDLTVENILAFDMWLHRIEIPRSEWQKAMGQEPQYISDATVWDHHKYLKKMLSLAQRMGKIDRSPYEMLKGQFSRGVRDSVDYLTDEEMDAIRNVSLQRGSHLDMVRDLFVVQIFTGMAYADLMKFNKNDYRLVDGKWVAVAERVKTGTAFIGHLLSPVVEVLEKYRWQVPQITNQAYNRALKKVGEKAGVTTSLHSHLARHTFATFMLSKGVKVENLQRMMGHTDIKMTQRYAKTLAQSVHEDFDMVEAVLAQK